ncbi:MAG: ADP-ribosylglycohydrolase family protein [Granulosicoccus sp.]
MTAKTQRENALIGAVVADAATMGMHWIYDQEHIKNIEKIGDVLFRQPDANIYEGVRSYFAHAAKRVGDSSQYGESARVVAQVIANHGKYDVAEHQQLFFSTFGPCGSYHGFADKPTKALIVRMINDGEDLPKASGSDDDQMPALSSVPALFSTGATIDEIESAVSVTSINQQAISGALALNDCLNRLINGESLQDALTNSASIAEPALSALLQEALGQSDYRPLETAQHFGLPCHMGQGLPVAWHLLQHAENFENVVRDNIRCGGDSCGRSMAVGSIAGLAFGVPDTMRARVHNRI